MHIFAFKLSFNLISFLCLIVKTEQQMFLDIESNSIDQGGTIIYPVPLTAPSNFTLLRIIDGQTAEFQWTAHAINTLQGTLRGYKIQMWSDLMDKMHELNYSPSTTTAHINTFEPFTFNYVRLYAYTDVVDGPTTTVISFETPEFFPDPVASFDAIPMSTHSIYLKWKQPLRANGILTGYHIYLAKKLSRRNYTSRDSYSVIGDPWINGLKISDLKIDTTYRFTIRAATSVGEGTPFTTEGRTEHITKMPDPPNFVWHSLPNINDKAAIKVIWKPGEEDHIGEEFFLAYRKEVDKQWIQVEPEKIWDQVVIKNLKPLTKYALRMVVVDGKFTSRSNVMIIETAGPGNIRKIQSRDFEYQTPIQPNDKVIQQNESENQTLNQPNNTIDNAVTDISTQNTDTLSIKKLIKCLADQLLK